MGLINPNKKYKNLITFGCSFTTGFMLMNEGSWGQHLSERLGCEHINKGGSQSNTKMVTDLIGYCETHDITDCCVGIQLSEHIRREFWDDTKNEYWTSPVEKLYAKHKNVPEFDFMDENLSFYMSIWFNTNENILRTINSIVLIKSYLNSKNIDFIMFEGIHSIMDYSHVLPNFKIPLEASLLSDTYKQSLLNDDTFFNTLGDWFTAMESHPLNNTDKNGSHPSMGVVKWWVDEMYKYINEKSNNNIL
jgi:hypothetical protein